MVSVHAGPSGFTDCCDGQCINSATTACCATTSGYVACPGGDVCAYDVVNQDYYTCCANWVLSLISPSAPAWPSGTFMMHSIMLLCGFALCTPDYRIQIWHDTHCAPSLTLLTRILC